MLSRLLIIYFKQSITTNKAEPINQITAKPDDVPLPPADDVQEGGEVAAAVGVVHTLPPDVAGETSLVMKQIQELHTQADGTPTCSDHWTAAAS